MNAAAIWYLVLTTVPGSGITYNPIGPLTEAQCHRVADAARWEIIIDKTCRKAIGYRSCDVSEFPYARVPCPIFEMEPVY